MVEKGVEHGPSLFVLVCGREEIEGSSMGKS